MDKKLFDIIVPESFEDWNEGIKYLKVTIKYNRFDLVPDLLKRLDHLAYGLELYINEDRELVLSIYNLLQQYFCEISLENSARMVSDSYLGTILWILHFAKSEKDIDERNVGRLLLITSLRRVFELVTDNFKVGYLLDNSEKMNVFLEASSLEGKYSTDILSKLYDGLFILFLLDVLEKDRNLVESFRAFYSAGVHGRYRVWVKRMYTEDGIEHVNENDFVALYKDVTGKEIRKSEIYSEPKLLKTLYRELINKKFPAYFDPDKLRTNGVIYNGNFFPLMYRDKTGRIKMIQPFKQVKIEKVQKIYNFHSNVWFTPKERYGKLLLEDIYSFREVAKIPREEAEKYKDYVASLKEDEIEERLRKIIGDLGHTPHTPIERVDYLTYKLNINNEYDLRDAGVVIKGGSFGSHITQKAISHQLIKAFKLKNVELVLIISIPTLADEVREDIEWLSKVTNKMHTIIDTIDLTRLFLAYNVLDI